MIARGAAWACVVGVLCASHAAFADPIVDVRAGRSAKVRTNGVGSFRIATAHVCRGAADLDFDGDVSGAIDGDRIDLYAPHGATVRYTVHCKGKRVAVGKLAVERDTTTAKPKRERLVSWEERVGATDDASHDSQPAPTGPPGYLRVKTRPAAAVHVDGVDTKLTTPIAGKALELAPGRHVITFVAGDLRFKRGVMIKPGVIEKLFVELPTN